MCNPASNIRREEAISLLFLGAAEMTGQSEAPEIAVEVTLLNALDEMLHGNVFGAVRVGYGAAYLKDTVVRPC